MNDGDHHAADLACFVEITRKLRAHDPSGMDDLRATFDRGLRLLLVRRGVQDAERISELVLSRAAAAVRRGVSFDPKMLPYQLRAAMNEIRPPDGRAGICPQPVKTAEAREVFASLDRGEHEALLRFYLREQKPAQICLDLGLTEDVFSALKSRARAKYFDLTRGPAVSR